MALLGLSFLGAPEIRLENQLLTFPIRKSIALLAYLSIEGKPVPRDTLATFFWPEQDQSHSRTSLRHALWVLSDAGLADWIQNQQDRVSLHPGYQLDISHFQAHLAHFRSHSHSSSTACSSCLTRLSQAVNLYRGEFMRGFTLRDSPAFDDWQRFHIESLNQELEEVLEGLILQYSASQDWERALPFARRWVALDPLHEPAHRCLMRIYALAGKRGLAIKQFAVLRDTLDRDIGVEPERETRQLYEDLLEGRILAQDTRSPSAVEPRRATRVYALPSPITPLLGRDPDVAAVREALLGSKTHLITLVGPPGIGKTRLSIQIATDLADSFKDGVCFVPLAPVQESERVANVLIQFLAIPESAVWTAEESLLNYLKDKNILLVLDNFEHILAAAPLVTSLLQACPSLRILVTSRSPLNLRGERQYPVSPLPIPDLIHLPPLETLSKTPSVALFVERASQVDPEFKLSISNAGVIAEICNRLDGLPLAIELAAPLTKLLPPQKLLSKLSSSLSLLRGGPVDLPPRQRTLRAAIDWSYDLLDPREQALLARLAVFVGGWTLDAAEVVVGESTAGDQKQSHSEILEGMFLLVDQSLVQRQERPYGLERYTMLSTIHEYAYHKLLERGEKEILQQRQAVYFLALAEASGPALRGSQQQSWLIRMRDEHDNLLTALHWAFDSHQPEMLLRLAGSLWRYWWMHGHLRDGRDWLEKALKASSPQPTIWRASALNGLGILTRSQGDYSSARRFLDDCLSIQRELQDHIGLAAVLNSLGVLAQYQGDMEAAERYHQESLQYRRELGDQRDIAVSLNNLGMVAQEQGDFNRAEGLFQESLAILRHVNDERAIAAVLSNQGALMNDRLDPLQAQDYFKQSLSMFRDLGQRDDIIEGLEGFAGVAVLLNQPERAARLFGAAQALRESIGSPIPPYKAIRLKDLLNNLSARLDPQTLQSELQQGKQITLEEAIEFALNGD